MAIEVIGLITMAQSQPLAPLSIGNIVSAAATLYRSHLKSYLGIALRATLWSFLPVVAFLFIGVIAGIIGVFAGNNGNSGITALFGLLLIVGVIGAIVLWVIGFTRYLVNSALISRLAFQELINQPETVRVARKALLPRQWSFFSISLRVGLVLVALYIGFVIGLIILLFTIGFILSSIIGEGIVVGLLLGLIGLVAFLIGGFILIWFVSRWFIAEVPLAVESNINGAISMQRSWDLTKNFVFQIQAMVIIAVLITSPVMAITSYVPQFFLIFLEEGSVIYWVVYVISLFLGLFGNLVVLPFWQTIKAVLYYDLRNRREGLNMNLRDN